MKKAATQTSNDLRPENQKVKLNLIPYKEEICLVEFLNRGSAGMFQKEADWAYGESCLHTMVSNFRQHGIMFDRKPNPITHRHGGKATYTRYRLLDDASIERAIFRVNKLRSQRGLEPLRGLPPYSIYSQAA
ncbi:hypothetical protein [Aliiglaciecola lipolytica]|uniref:Uncharacterized protein n=1 Tax=Aliiglaciecola lipolytica E3 TaxID=1127673 RepID=K6YBW7_9ALTE|nr:hypothetical protein [Aliiglaciecola lipolytica]GAC14143.1 hypothetical protein GLIP_1509 [Aliiglaciecola lipolytica E3]